MSPEQCDADPDAIDARSDVYALGIVLDALLTGRLPYKIRKHAARSSTDVIREQPPTRPSTIDRALRGDVETIVLQALEKDPERRYRSAAAFARDIRAYLAGEAIRARPPSAVYRIQLFGRRHKVLLSAVAVLAAVALVSALLVGRSHRRARQAEQAMEAALERATEAEAAVAESTLSGEAGKRKGTDMIGRQPGEFLLTTLDGKTLGTADFARYKASVLNFVNAACPHCIEQVPLVEKMRAEYESKGVRFVNVEVPMSFDGGKTAEEAREAFARIGSQIEFAQDESVDDLFMVGGVPTLSIVDGSGEVRQVFIGSRGDLMARLRGVLDALILGRPTPQEELDETEELHRQTLENNRRTLGDGHRDTLRSMENLAATLTLQGKHDEAEELYREILSVRRQFLGENDPRTLESMHQLAVVLKRRGKPAEAETVLRETVQLRRRVLGDDDPATRLSMAHLGMALRDQEKHEEAKPFMPALLELRRREARARDAEPTTLSQYAWLLLTCEPVELRDPATALDTARTAADLSGRQDERILDTLALAEKENGNLQAAIEIQKEALLLVKPTDGELRGELQGRLVGYYQEAEDLEGLETWLREELARMRASVPPTSLPLAFALVGLGETLIESGQPVEAEPLLREALEIGREALPENHWGPYGLQSLVGLSLVAQGRFEEAEPLVVESFLRLKDDRTVIPDVLEDAHKTVVRLYEDWGKPDEAARYRAMGPRGG
jgi:tetratricopeptide (TPR) repeat protein